MYHPILIYKLIKFTLRIEVYIMLYKIKIKKKGGKDNWQYKKQK